MSDIAIGSKIMKPLSISNLELFKEWGKWCAENKAMITEESDCFVIKAISQTGEYISENELSSLQNYLKSTDWYVVRKMETGKEIPKDVLSQRSKTREKINNLMSGNK